jgi:hypothetical protein
MKQPKTKEKRVINIDKEDFDIIKKYCDINGYQMPKWMAKTIIKLINDDINNIKII